MLAVKVAVLLEVVPTVTFPKLKFVGEIVRVPEVGGGVVVPPPAAIPESGTSTLAAVVENTVKVAEKLPLLFGTNFTVKVMLLPAPKLDGAVIPDNWNELA